MVGSFFRSGAERAVDPDGDQRADQERRGVHVGHLTTRIEGSEKQESSDAPAQRARNNLDPDEAVAPGAAMSVSQMPLAPGTRGHL